MIRAEDHIHILNALTHFRPKIEAALAHQENEGFTFDHVFQRVARNEALFFWKNDSCAVIEVRYYPAKATLHVFLGAGSTDGLLDLYEMVSDWGKRTVGATLMTTLCRKGFRRKLEKHGWKEPQVWLTKEIAA